MNSETKSTPQELIERARRLPLWICTEASRRVVDELADALEAAERARFTFAANIAALREDNAEMEHLRRLVVAANTESERDVASYTERDQLRAEVANLTQERDTFHEAYHKVLASSEAKNQLAQFLTPGASVEQVLQRAKVWREALSGLKASISGSTGRTWMEGTISTTLYQELRATEALRPDGEEKPQCG